MKRYLWKISENITPIGDGNLFYFLLFLMQINIHHKWEYNSDRRRKFYKLHLDDYPHNQYKWEYNSDRRRKFCANLSNNSAFLISENITPIGDGNFILGLLYWKSSLFISENITPIGDGNWCFIPFLSIQSKPS